jgi:hypothetical protein
MSELETLGIHTVNVLLLHILFFLPSQIFLIVAFSQDVNLQHLVFRDLVIVLLRCKREEAKITAWENLQKAKAEAAIRKLEVLFVVHMCSFKCFDPSHWSIRFCYVK